MEFATCLLMVMILYCLLMKNDASTSIQYLDSNAWSEFLTQTKTANSQILKNPQNEFLRKTIVKINQLLFGIEKHRQTLKKLEWNLENSPSPTCQRKFEVLLTQMNTAIHAVEMEMIKVKLLAK